MRAELEDFVTFCRVERRLAEATCRAYERDVRACMEFVGAELGIQSWGAVPGAKMARPGASADRPERTCC
jgi:site-specific recombinase XerC